MCKFCKKIFLPRLFLLGVIAISLGAVFGIIKSVRELPRIVPPPVVNKIEISPDEKSILNTETGETIFTIADAQKYLKDSGYFYNPDTFQTIDAKYEGDCFTAAALSNAKDRIVFSTGCLPGDLPQAWIGGYSINNIIPPSFHFLVGGSGRNFVWSLDDKTITYEATLGLSGMTETRTIDSRTGEILERKNSSMPTPTPLPSIIPISSLDISNWKTYRNKEYGFEFKYPLDWTLELGIAPNVSGSIMYEFSPISTITNGPVFIISQNEYSSLTDLQIAYHANQSGETSPYQKSYKEKQVLIGDNLWWKIDRVIRSLQGDTNSTFYWVSHGNNTFFTMDSDSATIKILSTFEFTK